MDLKEEAKSIGWGLLRVAIFIAIITYFRIGFLGIWLLIASFSAVTMIWKGQWEFINWVKSSAILAGLLFVIKLFFTFGGAWGVLLGTAACFGFILWQRWDKYIKAKQYVEKLIWGKPLTHFHRNGEKPPKIRFF